MLDLRDKLEMPEHLVFGDLLEDKDPKVQSDFQVQLVWPVLQEHKVQEV